MECSINVSDTLLSHGGVFFHIRTVFSCPVVLSVVEGGMMKSPPGGSRFWIVMAPSRSIRFASRISQLFCLEHTNL